MNADPGRIRRALRLCALALLAPLPAAVGVAEAQTPIVESVAVEVVPGDDSGAVDVAVQFRLVVNAATDTLRLTGLEYFGAEIQDLRARVGTDTAAADLNRSRTPAIAGFVRLPPRSAAGEQTVRLSYRVLRAVRVEPGAVRNAAVPVLLPVAVPSNPTDDFFTATIELPSRQVVYETFPTVPHTVRHGEWVSRYSLRLQAAPSLLRWRSREGDAPLLPFGRLVDIFTVVALAGLGTVAFRVLRTS